jgi:hypothetical protein
VACYLIGIQLIGNPNSLVPVMVSPILLWGSLLDGRPFVRGRRWVLFTISVFMADSLARLWLRLLLLRAALPSSPQVHLARPERNFPNHPKDRVFHLAIRLYRTDVISKLVQLFVP